jgi:septation ring formation regulator EzrA
MAVTLKTLLNVAPFPAEQRGKLLELYDQMSEDQKMRLSVAAWTALSEMYFAKLKYETDKLLMEIQDGKRKYNINDFKEAEARLIHEFAGKLESVESEESIGEVRKQLEKYKTQPLTQDKTISSPASSARLDPAERAGGSPQKS